MTAGKRLRIAIVGSGAVGAYYGALLARAGEDVHFLMRADWEAVQRAGLKIERGGDGFVVHPAQAYRSTAEIGPCDLVIVALKTTANESLPALMPPLLKAGTLILTLQNGLGNEAFLGRHFGMERILGGLCFICLNRTAPGVVTSFYPGHIVMGEMEGPVRKRTRLLAQMWTRAGVKCELADSLEAARWRKQCWNIPFNGLAIAAGGIDTQAILARPGLPELAGFLMKEVQAIARAVGHEIEDAFLRRQMDVTQAMGAYKPSSLIDYQLGRAVEVEAIWGEALRAAEARAVSAPRLQMLYGLLLSVCRRADT